jgi:hypothetical protein
MSGQQRGYKRSWKNLLINKRYQLRFTLVMVGLSAVLMGLLGWWVMTVAARATTLAVNNTLTACQDLPGSGARAAVDAEPAPSATGAAPSSPADAPAEGAGERPRQRPVVTIDDSGMTDPAATEPAAADPAATPPPPPPDGAAAAPVDAGSYQRCMAALPGKVEKLEQRQRLIFLVLIAAGVLITVGLLIYGIMMTHKVAGPLHKVTLYMAKLRGGVYDVVYNLRKGDQLVGFYEHFKAAHAGMRAMQEEDVVRLRQLLAAAERDGLSARAPAAAEAMGELRALLAEKEKSLV